jgi:hypothetical protein
MMHLATKLVSAALRGQMAPTEMRTLVALSAIGVFGGGYAIRASRRNLWSALKALALLTVAHSARGAMLSLVRAAFPSLFQRIRQLVVEDAVVTAGGADHGDCDVSSDSAGSSSHSRRSTGSSSSRRSIAGTQAPLISSEHSRHQVRWRGMCLPLLCRLVSLPAWLRMRYCPVPPSTNLS